MGRAGTDLVPAFPARRVAGCEMAVVRGLPPIGSVSTLLNKDSGCFTESLFSHWWWPRTSPRWVRPVNVRPLTTGHGGNSE